MKCRTYKIRSRPRKGEASLSIGNENANHINRLLLDLMSFVSSPSRSILCCALLASHTNFFLRESHISSCLLELHHHQLHCVHGNHHGRLRDHNRLRCPCNLRDATILHGLPFPSMRCRRNIAVARSGPHPFGRCAQFKLDLHVDGAAQPWLRDLLLP